MSIGSDIHYPEYSPATRPCEWCKCVQPAFIIGGRLFATLAAEDGTLIETIENKIRVSAVPYLYDIAEGNVTGHEPWAKIGYNPDVDAAQETVWQGGTLYTFLAAADQLEVISSDANDDGAPAGTGVQTVRIGYLDNTYTRQSETVTLNGIAAVTTTAVNILRVNSFRAMAVGTGGRAAGTITLRVHAAGATVGLIGVGQTRARNSVYTVPEGKNLFITSIGFSSCTGSATPQYCIATLYANYDPDAGTALNFMQMQAELSIQDQVFVRNLEVPLFFPEHTDLYMTARAQGASNLIVNTDVRGWLEDA